MNKGDSIENPIIIDAPNSIIGITEEHNYIDRLCSTIDTAIKSVEQKLIIENEKQYDKLLIQFEDGREKIMFFDVTSFFGKISRSLGMPTQNQPEHHPYQCKEFFS